MNVFAVIDHNFCFGDHRCFDRVFQVVEGSESLDMFMDMSNPYNKTVHAALQTVAEDMKNRLLEKGIEAFSSRNS